MSLSEKKDFNINFIIQHFCLAGEAFLIERYGSGHINDTFRLKNSDHSCPDYLLQRINHHVFKDVPGVIKNIELVTAHLRGKLKTGVDGEAGQKVLSLIPSKSHDMFYKDEDSNYWRVYVFIPGSRSYDLVSTVQHAYEGGRAFGSFQSLLSDMDTGLLSETIVDFHNIQKRLADFYDTVEADVASRVSLMAGEVSFIKEREEAMSLIYNSGNAGILPKRITHNDTKFNNILFNANDKAECIIDLDTVMPGHVAYDFGDAIRTIINSTVEDEPDLSKIQLNIPLFKAYTEGYIKEAGCFLTEKEIESLSHGVMLFPYMQGVRFLTDYIQGDTYYKTAYPGHNLIRARAQFELLKKLEEQSTSLQEIIIKAVENNKNTAPIL